MARISGGASPIRADVLGPFDVLSKGPTEISEVPSPIEAMGLELLVKGQAQAAAFAFADGTQVTVESKDASNQETATRTAASRA